MNENLVFWHIPANAVVPQIIDAAIEDGQGIRRGQYSGETIEGLGLRYSNPKMCSMDEYMKMHEDALRSEPVPCTEEDYIQALECLPPDDWKRVGGVESFKMSERFSGDITRIYVCSGNRFWSFMDRFDLSHREIAEKVHGKPRSMLCTCCGGRMMGRQWHNQDTGYGLCKSCIDYCADRTTDETMESRYGIRGMNYDLPEG